MMDLKNHTERLYSSLNEEQICRLFDTISYFIQGELYQNLLVFPSGV